MIVADTLALKVALFFSPFPTAKRARPQIEACQWILDDIPDRGERARARKKMLSTVKSLRSKF